MQNRPPQLPKHVEDKESLDSSLLGLLRDVDSYIAELNEDSNTSTTPTRSHSLQQTQKQTSPPTVFRSSTTYRPQNDNNAQQQAHRRIMNNNKLQHINSTPSFSGHYDQQSYGAQAALATFVEPNYKKPLPQSPYHKYGQHSDYVNTYLTNRKQQDKIYYDTPSTRSSSSTLSSLNRNNSNNQSVLVGRNSSLKSVVNNYELQPISTSNESHLTSPVLTPPSATTPVNSAPPEYAFLSVLAKAFMKRVRGLEHVRELFCANEYPESFTGQEAIKILANLLDGIPEAYCVLIANALMKSTPPLFDPIHYSQKSIIQGTVFNSPDEYYTLQEDMTDVPTGVLTSLLECYTFRCLPGKGGCYAPKCPNKPEVFAAEFDIDEGSSRPASFHQQQLLSTQSTGGSTITHPQMAWAQRVPKELLSALSKREIARQEAINEMIYSEEVYKNDLETLAKVIVRPLSTKSSIISSTEKRDQFVREVFGNYSELIEVSTALFSDLLELQMQHNTECVPMIGDILIKHFAYFENPFTQYCPRVSLAEYLVKEEERNNPNFERFIVQAEKSKRMRRLAFRHFLLNPVTRMQRYPLLIDAILKKTDEDHPDHTYLVKCLDMVKKVASQSDAMAEVYKKRVEVLEINDMIVFKQGEYQDLQLTDPHRRLYYQGDIKRRSSGLEVTEKKSDIHIFIFDHMVLMTKRRKVTTTAGGTAEEYRMWRKPIPMQMLYVGNTSDAPTLTPSSTRHLLTNTTTGYLHGPSNSTSLLLVPLSLHHLGQKGGVYTFLCTPEEKQKWKTAIDEAKASLKLRMGEDVYDLMTIDDGSFRYTASANSPTKQGRINCTVPFITIHNEEKIAVGTELGVFFKSTDRHGSIRKVLSSENVTQLAVLENFHILLVLSDKTLKAYPLDMLNSPTTNGKAPERLGQELGQHVNFFQVGSVNNKYLVVYKKKKNTSSIFTCVEPIYDLRDPKNQKYITQKTGFMRTSRSSHSWFKKYKEFYVGAESSNLHFLKSKFLIVCERGFEIIDPENLGVGGRDIPDKGDPEFNFVHRQGDSIKPLAMYRVHDKFLLCYNKFAYYVNNRNGSLVHRGPQKLPLLCEWEGSPENIVFQYPYVVAFDPQFIEVRHVDTGDLVQIIPGDQIRLTYYYAVGEKTVIQGCMTHSQRPEIQHIFYLHLNPLRNNARKFI